MSTNFAIGRKPDYNLGAMDKETDMKGKIGAAWINDDGSIGIKLNPWVVLDGANPNLTLRLFKNEQEPEPVKRSRKKKKSEVFVGEVTDRDENGIPF